MVWNWQHPDWPNFQWDTHKLVRAAASFTEAAGVVIGANKHLSGADREQLKIELLSDEAADTSAIEGELLDRDSIQSSIQKRLGLLAGGRRVSPAESGVAELMVDLFKTINAPLTAATLFRWHGMIMNGRTDLTNMGRYRTDTEPMQIVSGAVYNPRVHFEAPPASAVPHEMEAFLDWFEQTSPEGAKTLSPVVRAGVAHLWFESIHPFEDGNGRIGRAIAEKALSQGFSTPSLTGMAGTIRRYRKDYYLTLERASRGLDITDWLIWFADRALDAQQNTLRLVDHTLAKAKLMRRLRGKLNARQEKALLRMFAAGPDGFVGGMSAANYVAITGATTATTTRDLASLVALGALTRSGERKSTRYVLSLA